MAQILTNGNIVLGRFVWEKDGHHIYVCRRFQLSPRPNGMNTLHAAEVLDHQFGPVLCSLVCDAWNYLGCWCRRLLPAWDGSPDENWTDGPYPTWGSGEPLPPQVSGLLTLYNSVVPPRRPGHIYLPPADESANDNGVPSAAYLAAMNIAAAWLQTTHTEIPSGLLSPAGFRAVVWTAGSLVGIQVNNVLVSEMWATQRRRSGIQKTVGPPTEPSEGVE